MRKLLVLVLISAGCWSGSTAVSRSPIAHSRPSLVAVLPFVGEYSLGLQHDPEGGARAAEGCREALASQGISLVPRALLEAGYDRSQALDDATAAALARRLGADLVIVGSTTTGKFDLLVEARALRPDGAIDASVKTNEGAGAGDALTGIGRHACAALLLGRTAPRLPPPQAP